MQQRVPLVFIVEFPDDVLQKDVDEALQDALKRMQNAVALSVALPGRSSTGKLVAFRCKEIEIVVLPPLPPVVPPKS